MFVLLVIVATAIAVTYFVADMLDMRDIHPAWAILFTPGIAVVLWFMGLAYINSSLCTPIENCDGGGMLAFTANIVVLSFIGIIGSCLAIFVHRFWNLRR